MKQQSFASAKSEVFQRIGTMAAQTEVGHGEIEHLAYFNWWMDGCPAEHDLKYWLEAECQLKATWHLLRAASAATVAAKALTEARSRELGTEFTA